MSNTFPPPPEQAHPHPTFSTVSRVIAGICGESVKTIATKAELVRLKELQRKIDELRAGIDSTGRLVARAEWRARRDQLIKEGSKEKIDEAFGSEAEFFAAKLERHRAFKAALQQVLAEAGKAALPVLQRVIDLIETERSKLSQQEESTAHRVGVEFRESPTLELLDAVAEEIRLEARTNRDPKTMLSFLSL